ncbi:MAG: YtxH domain-containing protein [Chitinophagales bacterium]
MNSKVFVAALSGLGAGLALGMLFAPDKGTATRQRIIDKASDLSGQIKSTTENALGKINELGSSARNTYDKLSREVEQ